MTLYRRMVVELELLLTKDGRKNKKLLSEKFKSSKSINLDHSHSEVDIHYCKEYWDENSSELLTNIKEWCASKKIKQIIKDNKGGILKLQCIKSFYTDSGPYSCKVGEILDDENGLQFSCDEGISYIESASTVDYLFQEQDALRNFVTSSDFMNISSFITRSGNNSLQAQEEELSG